MIVVTKLDDTKLWINPEYVKFVRATPDTVITLSTGDMVIVKEQVEEICEKMVEFYRQIYKNSSPLPETPYTQEEEKYDSDTF